MSKASRTDLLVTRHGSLVTALIYVRAPPPVPHLFAARRRGVPALRRDGCGCADPLRLGRRALRVDLAPRLLQSRARRTLLRRRLLLLRPLRLRRDERPPRAGAAARAGAGAGVDRARAALLRRAVA